MTFVIIDRRLNSAHKSVGNRQRTLARTRTALKAAAERALKRRSIESDQGEVLTVDTNALDEPVFFRIFKNGSRKIVLPGNTVLIVGDRLPKSSEANAGAGAGSGGDSNDNSQFYLSLDEYFDLIFDGLELPNMVKQSFSDTENLKIEHDGHANTGSPSQLDVLLSLRRAKGRRIGLNRPTDEEILEAEKTDPVLAEALLKRQKAIPWLDPVDLKYHRFEAKPQLINKCVVFMLMDVSGSMSEEYRMLGKRFFLLLRAFLMRRYKHVEVVYINHADAAEEVNEKDFFYGHKSGGTLVSSGLQEIIKVQAQRYPSSEYNIYIGQVSDGDNSPHDNSNAVTLLKKQILPLVQYMVYMEVGGRSTTSLWADYTKLAQSSSNFVGSRVNSAEEIYPTFCKIFKKKD